MKLPKTSVAKLRISRKKKTMKKVRRMERMGNMTKRWEKLREELSSWTKR